MGRGKIYLSHSLCIFFVDSFLPPQSLERFQDLFFSPRSFEKIIKINLGLDLLKTSFCWAFIQPLQYVKSCLQPEKTFRNYFIEDFLFFFHFFFSIFWFCQIGFIIFIWLICPIQSLSVYVYFSLYVYLGLSLCVTHTHTHINF